MSFSRSASWSPSATSYSIEWGRRQGDAAEDEPDTEQLAWRGGLSQQDRRQDDRHHRLRQKQHRGEYSGEPRQGDVDQAVTGNLGGQGQQDEPCVCRKRRAKVQVTGQ